MGQTKDVIQHIKEEDCDSYSDDSLFSISSWGADLSFRELIQRHEDDELVKPELQRHYVWDRNEASRFIDSILMGLPVPSIFLAQTEDEKLLIVDGYQRIMTVRDYVKGVFTRDGKAFKLSRSERINARWRGKAFVELDDAEQRRVKNTTIHAIIFVQKEPLGNDTSLFQVFERINTSGRSLLAQEIRNCVAQGSFNKLLLELNSYAKWRTLFGLPEPDCRMRDMEFILRFFALSSEDYRKGTSERLSLKKFLDLYMKNNSKISDLTISKNRDRFTNAVDLVYNTFGSTAFHGISPSDPDKLVPKFSPTLCDSILIAADYSIIRKLQIPINPEYSRRELLQNKDFKFAITQETMSRKCINTRIGMASKSLFGVTYE